jgi:hypothetical protein
MSLTEVLLLLISLKLTVIVALLNEIRRQTKP